MTGRVRTNNNNALDPRTMPSGGATSGSAGRRSVQHGASVPVFLGQRGMGAARTTVLDKKFAAVGYDTVAMQGFLTNYDTERLVPRHQRRIDALLETFDKEFSDICDIRELLYTDVDGSGTNTLKLATHSNIDLFGLLLTFLPVNRAVYFRSARNLDVTIRVLEGILDAWRKNRPTEFDLSEVTALGIGLAAERLGHAVVTALKAELVECNSAVAECNAHRDDDDPFERAFKAFKRIVIPTYIALIETSDPAVASKLFEKS